MNTKILFQAALMLVLGANESIAESFNITSGLNFSAPTVNGTANVFQPQTGEIVYDSSTADFFGYNQSGSWINLSGGSSTFRTPTIQTFSAAGSGTYTTPTSPSPLYIRVKMVAGGGGGSGSGTAAGSAATAGGITTFGSSLLSATAGTGGSYSGGGGLGGTGSIMGSAIGITKHGGYGAPSGYTGPVNIGFAGGMGGDSDFGGPGQGGNVLSAGSAAVGYGSGGGGGGSTTTISSFGGVGGGAGGYVNAIIASPATSYSFVIGGGGTAGGAGTSGLAGGAGASGYIVVEEYYQ